MIMIPLNVTQNNGCVWVEFDYKSEIAHGFFTWVLHTDSEEWYTCLLTDWKLTVQIWECGKAGSQSGTLDSDGFAHLRPLMEGYEYSGWGSVLILIACLLASTILHSIGGTRNVAPSVCFCMYIRLPVK